MLTVSEITYSIKQNLEQKFADITVIGEISNFKKHMSGHWYLTLKDSDAQINCTMWRGVNNHVFFTPQDGMKIIATGKISVYPPRGSYQLDIRSMKVAGEGELQAAFEKLKAKLLAEGLFEKEHKKPITRFPKRIGIVTGGGSAAIEDMITTASRRYPLVELDFVPTKVQGDGAAEDIVKGIEYLNSLKKVDTIIVGRGGGSLEDLWAFNEEIVARAIFESAIPIISGVGHEIDFTIADFVSDLRAATPTAAMELATPNKEDILNYLNEFYSSSSSSVNQIIADYKLSIDNLLNSYGFRTPEDIIRNKQQFLDGLNYKIATNGDKYLADLHSKINLLTSIIKGQNVERILERGFAIIKQNGKFIKRANLLNEEESFEIKFYDNKVKIDK